MVGQGGDHVTDVVELHGASVAGHDRETSTWPQIRRRSMRPVCDGSFRKFDAFEEAHPWLDNPRVRTAKSAIGPSWDWCHTCGYDPAGLKPDGWLPETAAAPPTAPAAAPPHRRRSASGPTRDRVRRDPSLPARRHDHLGRSAPAARGRSGSGPVTTLVDPGAARPQEMRDPDWVQHEPRHGLLRARARRVWWRSSPPPSSAWSS